MLSLEIKLNVDYLNYVVFNVRDLSISELANKINYSRSSVYKVINKDQAPSLDFICHLCTHMNFTYEEHFNLFYTFPPEVVRELSSVLSEFKPSRTYLKAE